MAGLFDAAAQELVTQTVSGSAKTTAVIYTEVAKTMSHNRNSEEVLTMKDLLTFITDMKAAGASKKDLAPFRKRLKNYEKIA
jgi:hypothetical protein